MSVTFGSRLQQLRESCGISRRDLAARASIKPSYLEKVERGYNAPPSTFAILDIGKALGVDADELFALSGKLPPEVERLLLCSPLLVLLVRVASKWDADELKQFLQAQGVETSKLEWSALNSTMLKNDERRVQREPVTVEMKRAVFHLDGNECVYCSATTLLEVDHIQPFSLGGTNEIENLVTCCSKCNKKKGNRATPFVMIFGRFRTLVEVSL